MERHEGDEIIFSWTIPLGIRNRVKYECLISNTDIKHVLLIFKKLDYRLWPLGDGFIEYLEKVIKLKTALRFLTCCFPALGINSLLLLVLLIYSSNIVTLHLSTFCLLICVFWWHMIANKWPHYLTVTSFIYTLFFGSHWEVLREALISSSYPFKTAP